MADENPYATPVSQLRDPRPRATLDPERVGIFWGTAFASPLIFNLLAAAWAGLIGRMSANLRQVTVLTCVPVIIAMILSGRWWGLQGHRRERQDFLAAALKLGLVNALVHLLSSNLAFHLKRGRFLMKGDSWVPQALLVFAVYTLAMLLLGGDRAPPPAGTGAGSAGARPALSPAVLRSAA